MRGFNNLPAVCDPPSFSPSARVPWWYIIAPQCLSPRCTGYRGVAGGRWLRWGHVWKGGSARMRPLGPPRSILYPTRPWLHRQIYNKKCAKNKTSISQLYFLHRHGVVIELEGRKAMSRRVSRLLKIFVQPDFIMMK